MTLLLITAIGFSRIYLGVHYVSDVWSGYLVGAMWLIVAVSLSEWLRQKVKGDRSISPVARARPISFVLAFVAIGF
jgi:undecaprenyl-diphosphatase